MTAADLHAVATVIRELGATVIDGASKGVYAVEAAVNGAEVLPLWNNVTGHPDGKDPVGRLVPHGVLDATSDVDTVIEWWSIRPWNIGVRVPVYGLLLDFDGWHRLNKKTGKHQPGKGLQAINFLEETYDRFPQTWGQVTGSGGLHLMYRHPGGKLDKSRMPEGFDYKDRGGYFVLAPSVHPDSGEGYVSFDYPVADLPSWLIALLRPVAKTSSGASAGRSQTRTYSGASVADEFCKNTTWAEVLEPHGWTLHKYSHDGDEDGARWIHPEATAQWSATIRHGHLFVYSSNTPFRQTTAGGDTNGYPKFRSFTLLNFGGETREHMSAASKHLMRQGFTSNV